MSAVSVLLLFGIPPALDKFAYIHREHRVDIISELSVAAIVLVAVVAGLLWLNTTLLPTLDRFSMGFLVLMIVLIFVTQAPTITDNIVGILIIALPLTLQTLLIWAITYALAIWLQLSYDVAGPATLIACSNFFEMAVA
ncbi:hypothetical protein As57867_019239, partial [Aphanomyces stellatus]